MQHRSFVLGLMAALAGFVAADDASDVTQLTEATFNDFVKENPLVLAEFFAPWCGHCKALAPEYEEAATSLKEKNIKLAKIDCTEEADLCKTHGVEGYPTLKIFRGLENVSPYNGQRKAPAITSYMVKQSLPAVSTVTSENIDEFKKSDKVVLVGYYAADDKESADTFASVAEELRDSYLFGASTDAEVAKAEGVSVPAVVLYKSFDEGKNVHFANSLDAEAIKEFAKVASTPLIGEVGPETYSGYMSAGIPLAYIFAETEEERTALGAALRPIAEQYKGKINFATIDASAFGAHAGNLNLKTDKFPSFAIQDTVKNLKFPFDQDKEITHADISKFVNDYAAGKIDPSIKSEPIPESQDGPVTVVVAHTYKDIVLDEDKDVLIEFYAPWCGHCKALAPKYDELGVMYGESEFKEQVVIAKVDATANDVPDDIQGFPTIKLYPAGDKENPVIYQGARTVEDLIKFIGENGKYKAALSIAEEATEEAAPAATEEAAEEKVEEEADKHDEL